LGKETVKISGQNQMDINSSKDMLTNHGKVVSELHLVKRHLKKVLEEHGQAILRLKESEQKFKTVADYTYHWEYWLSPESKLLYNSPSCERLTGYCPRDFYINPDLFLSIVHPDDRPMFAVHRQCSCHTSETTKHIEFRIMTSTGSLRWIAHSCQPVYDSQGQFLGRRASNRDITTQKRNAELVRESEERLRLALDASSDGVWDKNLLLDEEYFGENWHQILGYTKQDVKQDMLSWHKLLHPDDNLKFIKAIDAHLEGLTRRYEVELRLRSKSGGWQWFLSRGKVVEKSDTGQPLRIVGTHTEITKNKENELELQAIKDTLEDNVAQKTNEIQDVHVALKVLLTKMGKDKFKIEQTIAEKIEKYIAPYLEKLQQSRLNVQQRIVLDTLTTNLQDLTAQITPAGSSLMNKLTPTEFQVANFVKHGKSTKEIAEVMHLSPGTISIHRKSIRKKLGISQQGINLQVYLNSFS
jgi:PAS domain S-box-containing protein